MADEPQRGIGLDDPLVAPALPEVEEDIDQEEELWTDDSGEDYTGWSTPGAARAKNVGWRIDYQIVTPSLRAKLKAYSIAPATPRFSDHAPYTVDYA